MVTVEQEPQETVWPLLLVCVPHLPAHVVARESGVQQTLPLWVTEDLPAGGGTHRPEQHWLPLEHALPGPLQPPAAAPRAAPAKAQHPQCRRPESGDDLISASSDFPFTLGRHALALSGGSGTDTCVPDGPHTLISREIVIEQ